MGTNIDPQKLLGTLLGHAAAPNDVEATEDKMSAAPPVEAPPIEAPPVSATPSDDTRILCDVAVRLWRIERRLKKLLAAGQGASADEIEWLSRRFSDVMGTLGEGGLEVLDHTGEKYDSGLSVRVLEYEPRPDLSCETIIETVRPSLLWRGQWNGGEVIVGKPQRPESEPSEPVEPEATELGATEPSEPVEPEANGDAATEPSGADPEETSATTEPSAAATTSDERESHEPQHD